MNRLQTIVKVCRRRRTLLVVVASATILVLFGRRYFSGPETAVEAIVECRGLNVHTEEFIERYGDRHVSSWQQEASQGGAEALYLVGLCHYYGAGARQAEAVALRMIRDSAQAGLPEAQLALGQLLEKGDAIAQDPTRAAMWYWEASESGLAEAQFALGTLYAEGRGIPADRDLASNLILAAAAANHDPAQQWVLKHIPQVAIERLDQGEVLQWAERHASQFPPAGVVAASILLESPDAGEKERAVGLLRQAADQDEHGAALLLGRLHEEGRGVSQDRVAAEKLYLQAAAAGSHEAELMLGLLNERRDQLDNAEKWLRKAKQAEITDAGMFLALLLRDKRKAPRDAVPLLEELANQGHPLAQVELARTLVQIYDDKESRSQAVGWLKAAIASGSLEGHLLLADWYQTGRHVERDLDLAFYLLREAAQKGSGDAQFELGECYAHGECGQTKNSVEAMRWYLAAAGNGHGEAARRLAKRYRQGDGAPQSESQAAHWEQVATDAAS